MEVRFEEKEHGMMEELVRSNFIKNFLTFWFVLCQDKMNIESLNKK